MTTPVANSIDGLANAVAEKWYAALGAAGLITALWVMIRGTPHDDLLIAFVAAAMIGIGFGETETRTWRQRVYQHGVVEIPCRKLTLAGAALYLLACVSTLFGIGRAVQLYLGTS